MSCQKKKKKEGGQEADEGREIGVNLREVGGTHGDECDQNALCEIFKDKFKYC